MVRTPKQYINIVGVLEKIPSFVDQILVVDVDIECRRTAVQSVEHGTSLSIHKMASLRRGGSPKFATGVPMKQ